MGFADDLLEAVGGNDKVLKEVVDRFKGYLTRYAKYGGKVRVGKTSSETMGNAVSSSTRVEGDGWYLVLSQYSSHGGDPTYKLSLMDAGQKAYLEGGSGLRYPSSGLNAMFRRIAELIAKKF